MKFKDEIPSFITFNNFSNVWVDNKPYSGAIEWSDGGKDLLVAGETHFFKNGALHNESGPASIWHDDLGKNGKRVICQEYFLDGKKYVKNAWKKMLKLQKKPK
jgi:hypothetical protein